MMPPRAQSFVGRDEDLTWLSQQLQLEPIAGGRAIAICGPGGIGKTALVAEALTQLIFALHIFNQCNLFHFIISTLFIKNNRLSLKNILDMRVHFKPLS
jgi:hypothetical protein